MPKPDSAVLLPGLLDAQAEHPTTSPQTKLWPGSTPKLKRRLSSPEGTPPPKVSRYDSQRSTGHCEGPEPSYHTVEETQSYTKEEVNQEFPSDELKTSKRPPISKFSTTSFVSADTYTSGSELSTTLYRNDSEVDHEFKNQYKESFLRDNLPVRPPTVPKDSSDDLICLEPTLSQDFVNQNTLDPFRDNRTHGNSYLLSEGFLPNRPADTATPALQQSIPKCFPTLPLVSNVDDTASFTSSFDAENTVDLDMMPHRCANLASLFKSQNRARSSRSSLLDSSGEHVSLNYRPSQKVDMTGEEPQPKECEEKILSAPPTPKLGGAWSRLMSLPAALKSSPPPADSVPDITLTTPENTTTHVTPNATSSQQKQKIKSGLQGPRKSGWPHHKLALNANLEASGPKSSGLTINIAWERLYQQKHKECVRIGRMYSEMLMTESNKTSDAEARFEEAQKRIREISEELKVLWSQNSSMRRKSRKQEAKIEKLQLKLEILKLKHNIDDSSVAESASSSDSSEASEPNHFGLGAPLSGITQGVKNPEHDDSDSDGDELLETEPNSPERLIKWHANDELPESVGHGSFYHEQSDKTQNKSVQLQDCFALEMDTSETGGVLLSQNVAPSEPEIQPAEPAPKQCRRVQSIEKWLQEN